MAVFCIALAATLGLSEELESSRPAKAGSAGDRLNVVLIVSDDQRAGTDGVMPTVERLLGGDGVTFSNFHVTTSECCPSRASILLGEYSHNTGVTDNFGRHSYPAFNEQSNLAVWLHDAGYGTALVGKYLNDYPIDAPRHVPPGWDTWVAMASAPEEKYYDYTLNENGRLVHYGRTPSDYSTTVETHKALRFLRRVNGPFFLYFAPAPPHLPAIPAVRDRGSLRALPPYRSPSFDEADISDKPWSPWHWRRLTEEAKDYVANDVRRRQLESLRSLDRSVAAIVATLRKRDMLDRTVILYLSDNGFLWGEHRLGGKIWPYEESTHVPLVVRTPWTEGDGSVDQHAVLNIDLASTISELAGISPGGPQDGYSFVPLLHGLPELWRSDFLVEYRGHNLLRAGGPPGFVGIHTPRYLYVEYRHFRWQELYDHESDPWELLNVAESVDYAQVRCDLHLRLNALLALAPHPGSERQPLPLRATSARRPAGARCVSPTERPGPSFRTSRARAALGGGQ